MPATPVTLIYRYLVVGESDNGDNLDFFVDAVTPEEAKTLWEQYMEGPEWEFSRGDYSHNTTWLVGPGGLERRVLLWDHEMGGLR